MKSPRFKVGEIVTYKYKNDCPDGRYHYGGNNYGGKKGKISEILEYHYGRQCYNILVSIPREHSNVYTMLEDEFIEYDKGVISEKDLKIILSIS